MASEQRFRNDKEVEELRKQLEGTSVSEPEVGGAKGKFANFTPGSHCVVFEGSRSEDDIVKFRRYHGPTQDQHKTRRCYEAYLAPSVRLSSSEDQFIQKFSTQYDLVTLCHNKEEHGELKVVGRFGKYYYFDDPPPQQMSVNNLNTFGGKPFKRGEPNFRSSLVPQEMKHSDLEEILGQKGYQKTSEEDRYMITVNPEGKSKISVIVVQNGNFEFVELRYPSIKWVQFNVVRKDEKKRDVRLVVESLRKATTEDTDDATVTRYKDASILHEVGGEVKVKPEFRREVTFVRQKATRKFRKDVTEADEEFYPDIELSKTKEFSLMAIPGARHSREAHDWKDEVVINATPLLPETGGLDDIKKFAHKFMAFCFEMESSCA